MKNIVLIGFMGVGKGSTAREIAKRAKVVVLDTDDIIESMQNRKIKKIFAQEGEEYFRSLERSVGKWLEKSVTDTLISTGGGFYKVPNIKKIGTVVLLDSSFEGIYRRLKEHPESERKFRKRPLFQEKKKAKELYDMRVKEYKKIADVIIDVEGKSVETTAKEIIKKVMK